MVSKCKDIVSMSLNYKDFTIIFIGSIGWVWDHVFYLTYRSYAISSKVYNSFVLFDICER